jgi:hypothetical protein
MYLFRQLFRRPFGQRSVAYLLKPCMIAEAQGAEPKGGLFVCFSRRKSLKYKVRYNSKSSWRRILHSASSVVLTNGNALKVFLMIFLNLDTSANRNRQQAKNVDSLSHLAFTRPVSSLCLYRQLSCNTHAAQMGYTQQPQRAFRRHRGAYSLQYLAAEMMLAVPGLRRRILTFASNETLCQCVRVSWDWFDDAVAVLYNTMEVRVALGMGSKLVRVITRVQNQR